MSQSFAENLAVLAVFIMFVIVGGVGLGSWLAGFVIGTACLYATHKLRKYLNGN